MLSKITKQKMSLKTTNQKMKLGKTFTAVKEMPEVMSFSLQLNMSLQL